MTHTLHGTLIDILNQRFVPVTLTVGQGRILEVTEEKEVRAGTPYFMPGFIDAHVHVESSMLVPSEFARLAVVHGTVATISDPHEIANVCGAAGVEYMIDNGKTVPFKFHFGAPSCVPASVFETAGAALDAAAVTALLERPEIVYLSEMMNYPGVLHGDPEVLAKIAAAKRLGKPVDGHAPGLRGEDARRYIAAGISTDHECFTYAEAKEKIGYGMNIQIREGSAARNFEALIRLVDEHPERMMFCSDDKHPDGLVLNHIDELVRRGLRDGIPLFKLLRAACINPVLHYKMNVGLLRPGDPADFIVVDSPETLHVLETWIDGQLVARNGHSLIQHVPAGTLNQFSCSPKKPEQFRIKTSTPLQTLAIEALDGQLITNKLSVTIPARNGFAVADLDNDLLPITVVNRYREASPALGWIHNFGIKHGAIASSVAHDSHNIVAVGVDAESIAAAVNAVIEVEGGVSVFDGRQCHVLPLPVAGLMSNQDGYKVAEAYAELDMKAKELGSQLRAPFMTLSFMALLVIPHLKLSDLGLFDGDRFALAGDQRADGN